MGSAKGLRQERFLTPGPVGSGRLSASWQPQSGPSTPSPVAAQFTSEGATLSGLDLELLGGGYRMSLVKRRFATGSCRAGLGLQAKCRGAHARNPCQALLCPHRDVPHQLLRCSGTSCPPAHFCSPSSGWAPD